MAGSGIDDGHVRDALGLYLLGALQGADRDHVERHLARCAACCLEADELGAAVLLLAPVDPRDARNLIAEFAEPNGHSPSALTDPAAATRPAVVGVAAPAGQSPGGITGTARRRRPLAACLRDRRSRTLLVLGVLVTVVLVSVGIVLGTG
ncbi:hypothetical protein GCM10023322_54910 [Rugosimonospora acidiphila]|uniref:Putative zinc-finger domain-containing protein n=1 Tax=Rugosimonospora acidiphila TaxID=556531 RepID=A0ABP9SC95_9ACTN